MLIEGGWCDGHRDLCSIWIQEVAVEHQKGGRVGSIILRRIVFIACGESVELIAQQAEAFGALWVEAELGMARVRRVLIRAVVGRRVRERGRLEMVELISIEGGIHSEVLWLRGRAGGLIFEVVGVLARVSLEERHGGGKRGR